MKHMRRLRVLVLLAAIHFVLPNIAWAASSGTCGDNLTWTLDDNGLLTISGAGEMTDFHWSNKLWGTEVIDVVIEDGVTSIGDYSFYQCSNLSSVTLPESITDIGENAFRECSCLTSIILPEQVTGIGNGAFYKCTGLASVTIPEGVTGIGDGAFYQCTSLTGLELPDALQYVGSYAFESCTSLTELYFPPNVSSVGSGIFNYCEATVHAAMDSATAQSLWGKGYAIVTPEYPGLFLRATETEGGQWAYTVSDCKEDTVQVVIPEGTTAIAYNAFRNCSRLTSVSVPDGVTTIGGYAFESCKSLTSIHLPDGMTSIGECAFQFCDKLLSINIPEGITMLPDYLFRGCTNLINVSLPDSLTIIGGSAFTGCIKLSSITLPPELTEINGFAFASCRNLKNVTLPEKVTYLGPYAFDYTVEKIYIPSSVATIYTDSFSQNATIYCYEYSYAESWAKSNQRKHVLLDGKQGSAYTKVSLPAETTVALGTPAQMRADVFPSSSDQAETWTSSNPGVATVDAAGVVTPVAPGITTITLTVNGVSGSGTVTVAPALAVFSLPETVYVISKTTDVLPLNIAPADAARDLIYAVGDSNYATIDANGQIKAGGTGTTTLTVIDRVSGKLLNANLCVTYPVSAISFAEPAVTAPVGMATRLTANVTMRTDSCVNQLVTFASGNPAVAVVDQHGYVTGVSQGSAVITATAASGVSASCTVTVVMADTLMLPEALTMIGEEAFAGVSAERVVIPGGCTTIGARAFANSARLTAVYMPDTVTSIAQDAFEGCAGVNFLCESQNAAYQFAQANGIACRVE